MAYRCSNNEENLRKNLEACKAKQEELQVSHTQSILDGGQFGGRGSGSQGSSLAGSRQRVPSQGFRDLKFSSQADDARCRRIAQC